MDGWLDGWIWGRNVPEPSPHLVLVFILIGGEPEFLAKSLENFLYQIWRQKFCE